MELESLIKVPGSYLLVGTGYQHQVIELFTHLNGHIYCGSCVLCKQATAGVHVDLVISEDDSIEEARRIVRLIGMRTNSVKFRVVFINGYRNHAWQNVLLKTLEEPGLFTFVIWAMGEIKDVLDTVLSRCQVLAKAPPPFIVSKEAYAEAELALVYIEEHRLTDLFTLFSSSEIDVSDILEAFELLLIRKSENKPIYLLLHRKVTNLGWILRRGRPIENYLIQLMEDE